MTIQMRMLLKLSIFLPIVSFADFRQRETIREYVYDFSVSGSVSNSTLLDISEATTGSTKLPLYVTVEDVTLKVITALSPSSGVSLTVGNSVSSAGYFTAKDISLFTDNAVMVGDGGFLRDPNGFAKSMIVSGTNDRNFGLKVSSGTSLTAGKILFKVKSYLWGQD